MVEIITEKEKRKEAALKAWSTIRRNRIEEIMQANESIEDYLFDPDSRKIQTGTYHINPPLIKPSKLTWVEKGGVGKELSDGWSLNFAIGCTHACRFCYVDSIHKRYGARRGGKIVNRAWGNYFLIPDNIDDAIEKTNWKRWKGAEVMMSSTHDPYLPSLTTITRKILESALPEGVRFCIQTRSPLSEKDFSLLAEFKDQIRYQVSVATMNKNFASIIEPRVAPPETRLQMLRKAKEYGLTTGIIIAPIFPSLKVRNNVASDIEEIVRQVSEIRPDNIYGECIHSRGSNMGELEAAIGEKIMLGNFDSEIEIKFHKLLNKYGLSGRWWKEHK